MENGLMRNVAIHLLVAAVVAATGGCASRRVEGGHRDLRQTILALHEEQLVDNLVRLKKGLPIAHLDYTSLFAEMSDSASATGGIDYTNVDNVLRAFDGAAIPATDSLANGGSRTTLGKGTATAGLTNKLTLTAAPVMGKNIVYGAYLSFLELQSKQDGGASWRSLEGPTCQPPQGRYVLRRQYADGWWYVPTAFQEEFRDLGLAANNLNREPPSPSKRLAVRVQRLHRLSAGVDRTTTPDTEHVYLARVAVPLPIDTGHVFVKLRATGDKQVRMEVLPATQREIRDYAPELTDASVILGRRLDTRPADVTDESSSELILKFRHDVLPPGVSLEELEDELRGLTRGLELKLDKHEVASPEPTEELLRSLNDKLEQLLLRTR